MRNSNVAIHNPQLTVLEEQNIDLFFAGIEQVLDFGEALRPKERREITKLHRQNLIFVREAMESIEEVPELLPGYVDEQVIKDRFKLHEQLRMLEDKTGAFLEKVRDLRYVLGSQSYEDGLMIYSASKLAATGRVPKATYYMDRMKRRFSGQGPNGASSADSENVDNGENAQRVGLARETQDVEEAPETAGQGVPNSGFNQ